MQTSKRFKNFTEEPKTTNSIIQKIRWLRDKVKTYKEESTAFHDGVIILKDNTKIISETQITNYGDYCKYYDIRLDFISVFNWKNSKLRLPEGREGYNLLVKNSNIKKRGKLFNCDAHIILFAVMNKEKKIYLVRIYDNKKLKTKRDYFIDNYLIKTNIKEKEKWESAFIPVDKNDKVLHSCEVNSFDELKGLL